MSARCFFTSQLTLEQLSEKLPSGLSVEKLEKDIFLAISSKLSQVSLDNLIYRSLKD